MTFSINYDGNYYCTNVLEMELDPDKNPANTELAARIGRQGLDRLKGFLSQVDAVTDPSERNRMMGAFANSCASAAGLKS